MSGAGEDRPFVVVAGVGQAGPVAEDPRSIPEMVLEAVERALDDAGLGYDDVDAVVTASVDLLDGLTASNVALTEVVGAVMRPETRIAGDGLCAAIHATCQLWAGAYGTVLVVAHGKASMAEQGAIERWAMDPICAQPLGADFLAAAGLQARALLLSAPDSVDRWAEIASKRRCAAAPRGVSAKASPRDVLSGPMLASPITSGMCAPPADAAYAVVLRAGPARGRRALVITGTGHDMDVHSLGDRDLTCWDGLERAVARARRTAGVEAVPDAFDLLEPSCRFAHEEGLFHSGTGTDGRTVRVSPEGGLFAGAAPVAAGLGRLVSAARAMRQDASLRRALVHGTWGPAGQAHAVAIVEARE